MSSSFLQVFEDFEFDSDLVEDCLTNQEVKFILIRNFTFSKNIYVYILLFFICKFSLHYTALWLCF